MFVVQKNEATSKTIRMPNALIEQLEEIAANEDISFNQLVVKSRTPVTQIHPIIYRRLSMR